jgi:hypothetical protein
MRVPAAAARTGIVLSRHQRERLASRKNTAQHLT